MIDSASPEPRRTAADLLPGPMRRFIPVLAFIAISFAVVGFLLGIHEPAESPRPIPPPAAPASGPVPDAVTYAEMPAAKERLHPAAEQSLAQLRYDRPGIFDTVVRTDAMKRAALADRARNRAYDGAPPTIPHPIDALSSAACLACHGEGLKVGDRLAARISHAHLSHCTQCHVEETPGREPPDADVPENSFRGIVRAGPGARANPGAPPTIPHHLWMREDCMSCHGLVARPGLRTTHPWLTNCLQCHAPSAALDLAFPVEGSK